MWGRWEGGGGEVASLPCGWISYPSQLVPLNSPLVPTGKVKFLRRGLDLANRSTILNSALWEEVVLSRSGGGGCTHTHTHTYALFRHMSAHALSEFGCSIFFVRMG